MVFVIFYFENVVRLCFRAPAVKAKLVKYFQLRKQAKEIKVICNL